MHPTTLPRAEGPPPMGDPAPDLLVVGPKPVTLRQGVPPRPARRAIRLFRDGAAFDAAPGGVMARDATHIEIAVAGSRAPDAGGASSLSAAAMPLMPLAGALRLNRAALADSASTLEGAPMDDTASRSLIAEMWRAGRSTDPGSVFFVEQAMTTLALMALRSTRTSVEPPPATDRWFVPPSDLRLRRVIDYVEDHYGDPLTVSDLASVAAMSQHHFSKCFAEAIGTTPHRYLVRRRVRAAQTMMRSTRLDLASIAFATGFASHSHMTRVFTQQVGRCPSSWREGTG